MRQTIAAIAVLGALASACASSPEAPAGPPDYTALTTGPASPNARLYADCIGQAAGAGTYRQFIDDGDELILFTCTGAVARAFYDALASHSAEKDSQFVHDDRTVRSTAKIQRNLIGVDYCSVGASGDHQCVITFNAGDFLLAGD